MRQRRTSRGNYRCDGFETAGAAQAFVTALTEAWARLGRSSADRAGAAKGAAWKVALAADLRRRAGPSVTWLASPAAHGEAAFAAPRSLPEGRKARSTISGLTRSAWPGHERQEDADYLDPCRNKRNIAEYDAAGQVSAAEAKELASFARELREAVIGWLDGHYPELSPWKK